MQIKVRWDFYFDFLKDVLVHSPGKPEGKESLRWVGGIIRHTVQERPVLSKILPVIPPHCKYTPQTTSYPSVMSLAYVVTLWLTIIYNTGSHKVAGSCFNFHWELAIYNDRKLSISKVNTIKWSTVETANGGERRWYASLSPPPPPPWNIISVIFGILTCIPIFSSWSCLWYSVSEVSYPNRIVLVLFFCR